MFRTLLLAAAAALGLAGTASAVTLSQTFDTTTSSVFYNFDFGAGFSTIDLVEYEVISDTGGGNLSSGLALIDLSDNSNVTAMFTSADVATSGTFGNYIRIGASNNVVSGQMTLTDGANLFSGLNQSTSYRAVLFDNNGDPDQFSVTLMAAVPLPAALPMLLAALGGFGLLRRRRQAAA